MKVDAEASYASNMLKSFHIHRMFTATPEADLDH